LLIVNCKLTTAPCHPEPFDKLRTGSVEGSSVLRTPTPDPRTLTPAFYIPSQII